MGFGGDSLTRMLAGYVEHLDMRLLLFVTNSGLERGPSLSSRGFYPEIDLEGATTGPCEPNSCA